MSGLIVCFDEYTYRFDAANGWWICEQDGETISTDSIARWIKYDADEEHRRATEKAQ